MLSENIKRLRKDLRLTQTAFGEKLGVGIDVIKNLEYGRTSSPNEVFLNHICEIYNVDREWLENGDGDPKYTDVTDADILTKLITDAGGNEFVLALARSWMKLDEKQREVLNSFIDQVVADYQQSRTEHAEAASIAAVKAAASEKIEEKRA
ncbi:MAG: helix-turn-helix transcriptional regulator [Clostridia bacterium]|nr:helix-turn-helix transcriptional regulator [Clostridia bacterium]